MTQKYVVTNEKWSRDRGPCDTFDGIVNGYMASVGAEYGLDRALFAERDDGVYYAGELIADRACAYCDYGLEMGEVPNVDEDEEWTRLALWHDDDCEWIKTRAHRREVRP